MRSLGRRPLIRATLLLAAGLCLGAAPAAAPRLSLTPPEVLKVGDRASVAVTLALPPDAARPLLLTPSCEGDAVEVVRGRLLRSDARAPDAAPLVFDVPVVAQQAGTSVFRVHALTYRCEERCVAVEVEASVPLQVEAR